MQGRVSSAKGLCSTRYTSACSAAGNGEGVPGHQDHFQFGAQRLAEPGDRMAVDIGQLDVAQQHVDGQICSQGIVPGAAIVCFEYAVTGALQASTTSSCSRALCSIKRMRSGRVRGACWLRHTSRMLRVS